MKKKIFFTALAGVLSITILYLGFFIIINKKYGTSVNGNSINLIFNKDVSIQEGAKILYSKGIISSKMAFVYFAKIHNSENTFKAGKYIVNPKTSLNDLLAQMQSGKSDFIKVTIPEGYSLYQIATTLEEKKLISNKDDLLNTKLQEFDPNGLIQPDDPSKIKYPLEGYICPGTYYIPVNSKKDEILKIMTAGIMKYFTDENLQKAKASNLKNVNQVIILASILEKEAANNNERPTVASVLINRLNNRGETQYLLQVDASSIYATYFGERTKPLGGADVHKVNSPYNTYKNKYLTPGPICSPGKLSVDAVLNPAKTDYYFYVCPPGQDASIFVKTMAEQNANVNKYFRNNK